MTAQNLPATAREYARASRLEQQAALAAVLRQWRRMGGDFDSSWAMIAPTLLAIVGTAQRRTAESADAYIPAVLEETGQTAAIAADAEIRVESFVGVTGAGTAVADQLSLAPIRAKQARQSHISHDDLTGATTMVPGMTEAQALASAGQWLTATQARSSRTRAAQSRRPAWRRARSAATYGCSTRHRAADAPSWPASSTAKTKVSNVTRAATVAHIPASEGIAGDMTLDLNAYLGGLDEAGQIKVLGSKANLEAWRDYGAEPQQIINAYRGGIRTAQDVRGNTVRYTTDAATRRSLATYRIRNASRLDRDAGAVLLSNRQAGLVRRMPETILRTTQGRERILHQLRLYGWIA